jgi:putative Holliday junction resolvase
VRYLGVDPGGKRVGLAVGDDTTGVVSPLEIIPYQGVERAAQKIADFAAKVGAVRVVLGLPTLEDGSRGSASRRTERLAEALASLGVDIALQSEFLSTNEARRRARAAGRRSRQAVDDIAAQVLLEEYIASRSAAPAAES